MFEDSNMNPNMILDEYHFIHFFLPWTLCRVDTIAVDVAQSI